MHQKNKIFLKNFVAFWTVLLSSSLCCGCCAECHVMSMGRGQESAVRRVLTQTIVHGSWLVLQNGHFCTDYLMETLSQITSSDMVHSGFRLWITSESCDQFPVNFLQVG